MVERNLKSFSGLFSEYTELRMQENRVTRIALVKGNLVRNSRSVNSGVSARVYRRGSWGFASSPEMSADSVESVVHSATDNAVFLDSRTDRRVGSLPFKPATSENDFTTKKARLSQVDLVDFIKALDDHILKSYPLELSLPIYYILHAAHWSTSQSKLSNLYILYQHSA